MKPRNFPEKTRQRQIRAWERANPNSDLPDNLRFNRRSIKRKIKRIARRRAA